jgi:hypothetical protein
MSQFKTQLKLSSCAQFAHLLVLFRWFPSFCKSNMLNLVTPLGFCKRVVHIRLKLWSCQLNCRSSKHVHVILLLLMEEISIILLVVMGCLQVAPWGSIWIICLKLEHNVTRLKRKKILQEPLWLVDWQGEISAPKNQEGRTEVEWDEKDDNHKPWI